MRVQWWSCMLGLFCLPPGVILNQLMASQHPSSILFVKINSSTEISCSTSLSKPLGLYLYRQFPKMANVVYLDLENGQITKTTVAMEFQGRIRISAGKQVSKGTGLHSFTMELSLLRVEDTNVYYCSWSYYDEKVYTAGHLANNGTIIIVRETNPDEVCKADALYVPLLCGITVVTSIIVILGVGALIFRCTALKKVWTPGQDEIPPESNRHQLVVPEQPAHHWPYLITSLSPPDHRGFF